MTIRNNQVCGQVDLEGTFRLTKLLASDDNKCLKRLKLIPGLIEKEVIKRSSKHKLSLLKRDFSRAAFIVCNHENPENGAGVLFSRSSMGTFEVHNKLLHRHSKYSANFRGFSPFQQMYTCQK